MAQFIEKVTLQWQRQQRGSNAEVTVAVPGLGQSFVLAQQENFACVSYNFYGLLFFLADCVAVAVSRLDIIDMKHM